MTKTTNVKLTGNNVLLVSDNLNYLCLKAKDILENQGADSLEVVYDSVVNTDNKGAIINYDSTENTILKMRNLLGTSNYNSIWIKGFSAMNEDEYLEKPKSKRGRKPKNTNVENSADTKKEDKDNKDNIESNVSTEEKPKSKRGRKPKNANVENTESKKDNNDDNKDEYKNPTGRRGAPSLSQDVLDFRYDVISDYDADKITTEEAIEKLGVTEGVFRNLVSEFHRCQKANRRKAFGKSGIIKRTYKLYSENKISSNEAAENIGVSVATFLNWYKADNDINEIGRGRKRIKSK